MTGTLWLHNTLKTPPDKPGPSGAAMGYRRRIDKRATAMLVLLLQLLYLSVSVAAESCWDPTSLSAPSNPASYTYTLGASAYTWTIGAWTQDENCAYTETLTFSPDLSTLDWISVSGRTVSINSSVASLHGTSQAFTVTTTLNDDDSTANSQYVFTIVLDDPCNSYVAPTDPASYTYTLGASAYTWDIPAWTQGGSCSSTETLTFSPALSTLAWISVSGRTVSISSSVASLHGTSTDFTVTSTLNDGLTTNDNGYTFTIVLDDPCNSYVAPSDPASYTYTLGASAYTWTIPAWTQG